MQGQISISGLRRRMQPSLLHPAASANGGAVHAEDMSPVTPETAAHRPGWKVTEMGRIIRPVRIRPTRPLPPPLVSSVTKTASESKETGKPPKRRDPDSRARRRTIDMTRWGNTHLKGIFLEDAGQGTGYLSQDEVQEMVEAEQSDSSSDINGDGDVPAAAAPVELQTPAPAVKPIVATSPPAASKLPTPISRPTESRVSDPTAPSADIDLGMEKDQSLSLLNSLFGAKDDWGGRESIGSDVDEEELLKIGGDANFEEDDDAIEFVPMDIDVREPAPVAPPSPKIVEVSPTPQPPPKAATQATKLKDLFVSREEDVGFSLLGHLDLDLELDEELAHIVPSGEPAESTQAVPQLAATFVTPTQTHITLDPKQPLFFPLPTSFSSASASGFNSIKARQRDILDVGKDNGWNAHFHRTETDDEIRAKWEKEKVDLTREWNRRWREAGKVRRRRGGGDGD
ncbi:hypothetical protein MVEN_00949500 [Mycena venus]|uniref:Uncharacterized protein n=1 Tax=Mycena venus TaxID=2733690 RepID=A0A8H6YCX3_9AGAR|nr:hypothetical protein MVEN_00949500 [Mycena venus]